MVDGKGNTKDNANFEKASNETNIGKVGRIANTDNMIKLGNLLVSNNTKLLKELRERKELLSQIAEGKIRSIKNAPKGKLHIAKRGKYRAYYIRKSSKDLAGDYINRKNIELAYQLAQAEYDKLLIAHIYDELSTIDRCINNVRDVGLIKLKKEDMNCMVNHISSSDENYIEEWKNVEYKGKGFENTESEFYTANNERVRSKSEIMIADALCRMGVPYRYEYPITLDNGAIIYPDFYCLNVRKRHPVIYEHFGLMDVSDYVSNVIYKLHSFESNGLRLGEDYIFTMETSAHPLSTKTVNAMISKYLL